MTRELFERLVNAVHVVNRLIEEELGLDEDGYAAGVTVYVNEGRLGVQVPIEDITPLEKGDS